MNDLPKQKPVLMFRYVVYAVISAGLFVFQGYARHDPKFYVAAIFAILLFIGLGLTRNWLRDNPSILLKILTVMVVIGLFAGIVATVLDVLKKK